MHSRCLSLLLEKSYKSYVTTKAESVCDVDKVTWSQIKQWLFEHVDTPKQKIKNTKAFANLTPEEEETAESLSSRMLNLWGSVDMSKVSVAEYTIVLQLLNMLANWRQRMTEMISNAPEDSKKTYPEMIASFNALDLKPESIKRKQDAYHLGSAYKRERPAGKSNTENSTKVYNKSLCRKGCGMRYTTGNNETCLKKESKKFFRAAVRTPAH